MNARRVELITLNTPLIESFKNEEAERKAKLASAEGQAADEDERNKVLEAEVSRPTIL